MRTLTTLTGNSQKLDGGAMFGNAPKALWQRWMPADELNRIDLGCRALLVQEEERNILVETGIGAFFSPELKQRFGVQEDRHVLLDSLAALGLSDADIDIVVLTHLHFDHAGGLLAAWQDDQPPRLLFPHAQFVTGRQQWQRARLDWGAKLKTRIIQPQEQTFIKQEIRKLNFCDEIVSHRVFSGKIGLFSSLHLRFGSVENAVVTIFVR